MIRHFSAILAILLFFVPAYPKKAQAVSSAAQNHLETSQEFVARITPSQKERFETAAKTFSSHQYSDALSLFKSLLEELPSEPLISKFAAEAALQSGDTDFALHQLKPIVQANPDDWQALSLLTRAYAESGDKVNRDKAMSQMLDMHKRGLTPSGLKQYTLERLKVGDNSLIIHTSLEPWGPYKVYDYGQVADPTGDIFLRISLESGDGDQTLFAKDHPKDFSEGKREFSLDAYRETGQNSNNQRTQTHYTYKFFNGQPSYDIVREAFIQIATGKVSAITSRSNLIVP
jgi:tetratricopeptide (TPR) repeat protein